MIDLSKNSIALGPAEQRTVHSLFGLDSFTAYYCTHQPPRTDWGYQEAHPIIADTPGEQRTYYWCAVCTPAREAIDAINAVERGAATLAEVRRLLRK